MQAAQEIGSCAEALGRGTDLMVKLHALEDAGAVDALAASPYFGGGAREALNAKAARVYV